MRVAHYLIVFMSFFVFHSSANAQTVGNTARIAEFEGQVRSLNHTKDFLENNRCLLKVGTDEVAVGPKVIRSNGVILGVADQLKGTYFDFEGSISAASLIRSLAAVSDRVESAHLFKFIVNESSTEILIELLEASATGETTASYGLVEQWTIALPLEAGTIELSGKTELNIDYSFTCEQRAVAAATPVGSPIENALYYLNFDIEHQKFMTELFKSNEGCSFNYGAVAKMKMDPTILNGSRDHIAGYSRTNASLEPIKFYSKVPSAQEVSSDPSVDFLIKASIWYDKAFKASKVRFSVLVSTTNEYISGRIYSDSTVASSWDKDLNLKTGSIVANDGEELTYTCQ